MKTKRSYVKSSAMMFACAVALSAQAECSFNPVIPDWIADPSVSKFGDTFYLYGTTDIDKELSMAGVPVVWKSKDFVNWSFEGPAVEGVDWRKGVETGKDKDGNPRFGYWRYWAPGKVIETNGRFHLYVTLVDPKGNPAPTVLMVADRPEGPFRFAEKIESDDGANGPLNRAQVKSAAVAPDIDGDPFVDDDGTAYIVWRKRWIAKLNAERTKTEGRHIELKTALQGYSEGPCLFKRNGIYYYLYTIGGCDGYHYGYMMSKVSPLEGWTDPSDPIVVESNYPGNVWGPGHGNVFESDGNYYIVYLEYGEGGTTRQVMANRMEFDSEGRIVRVVPDLKGVGCLGPNQETRTNLARKAFWTASSVRGPRMTRGRTHRDYTRTFAYDAQFAGDGNNGTRWAADGRDKSSWIQADFGAETFVGEIKMFFTQPAFGHNWKLEGSLDGKEWMPVAEERGKPCRSPHVAKVGRKVRYLRIGILDGDPGLWEVKVYE